MATFSLARIKNAWNAFANEEENPYLPEPAGYSGFDVYRPDRFRSRVTNERTIISSIYARLSIDASDASIRHTRHDDSDRYLEDIQSGLNDCLTVEANVDQGARAFRQDIVLTALAEGVAAIVPVDTTLNPFETGGFDIKSLRVGTIVQWYPRHVRVSLYNDRKGKREEITLEKKIVAVVQNPLYSVMNEPNSTLQRLMRKLSLLDSVDEQSSSGKMDLIIQLPYVIKSEARRQQADQRRKDIEFQLKGSQYGIAYTDGTEKITQLNRPVENNLMAQVEYLTNMLYSQLGLTPEVMNGTADEATMLNYNSRTIQPIMDAIVEAMRRTFLTKTARTQKQSIDYFRNPFKLVPVSQIAEISDKLTRNEILTSNEIRQALGYKPSQDPKADQLVNSNMPQSVTGAAGVPPDPNAPPDPTATDPSAPDATVMASSFDSIDSVLGDAMSSLGLPSGSSNIPPPDGGVPMDPSIMSSSLDDIDSAIDDAFSGLEGP